MSEKKPITYRDAGVDIDAATDAIAEAKARIEGTQGPDCLSKIGSFGGLYRVPVERYREPVLVSSTDSVGTKVKVAVLMDKHDTVGQDIVNHCVNDILVQGAVPIYFLDYIGIGRVTKKTMAGLLTGLAKACEENECALLGGETAEMTDVYSEGEYDLVGTVVGIVERERILDGSKAREGDVLIGLPSTGLHTNGYTLARKVLFEREGLSPDSRIPELQRTVGEELLRIHRSYLHDVKPLLDRDLVHSLAHLTGGGFTDNLPRVLPDGLRSVVRKSAWRVPPIFEVLAEKGPVPEEECYRAFNMGIGLVVVADREDEEAVLDSLRDRGADPVVIGEVVAGEPGVDLV
jgi:phosphoribosylformylglycinamidine cyclo-ligase